MARVKAAVPSDAQLATVLTATFNLGLNLIVVFAFILAWGVDPTWTWLLFPLGVLLSRPAARRFTPVAMGLANAGQAAPVIGVIVLLAMAWGFGFRVAVLALSLYAFLPVLANTLAGLRGVDPTVVEAARGMGMSPLQTLLRVELPLALPVIMAGLRTALVLLVGTGAFATFIDAGGLGLLIQTGIVLFRFPLLVSGAILVAALALMIEWIGRLVETLATPRGLA